MGPPSVAASTDGASAGLGRGFSQPIAYLHLASMFFYGFTSSQMFGCSALAFPVWCVALSTGMFRMRFSADTYRLMQPALGGCVGGQRIPVVPGGRTVRPGAVGRRAA